jgi:hypothetical protein
VLFAEAISAVPDQEIASLTSPHNDSNNGVFGQALAKDY